MAAYYYDEYFYNFGDLDDTTGEELSTLGNMDFDDLDSDTDDPSDAYGNTDFEKLSDESYEENQSPESKRIFFDVTQQDWNVVHKVPTADSSPVDYITPIASHSIIDRVLTELEKVYVIRREKFETMIWLEKDTVTTLNSLDLDVGELVGNNQVIIYAYYLELEEDNSIKNETFQQLNGGNPYTPVNGVVNITDQITIPCGLIIFDKFYEE